MYRSFIYIFKVRNKPAPTKVEIWNRMVSNFKHWHVHCTHFHQKRWLFHYSHQVSWHCCYREHGRLSLESSLIFGYENQLFWKAQSHLNRSLCLSASMHFSISASLIWQFDREPCKEYGVLNQMLKTSAGT